MAVHAKSSKTGSAATETPYFWQHRLEMSGIYLFIIAIALFNLTPFAWPFLSAFGKKPENVSGLYLYWPASWTLQNFIKAVDPEGGNILNALRNSLLTAGGGVVLAVVACTLAGYTLSRMQFRGKTALMYGILLLQTIPFTATVLPLYLIMRDLGLIDTLLGVTMGLATAQIPFITWVMKGFFDGVPEELEEAAWLDGAGRLATLFRIILPLALPGVGAAAVLAFNSAWGQFFLPLILLSDPEKYVLPLALFRSIINYTVIDYGMMTAMSLVYMLPSLIFFLLARKYMIRGMMRGAMAGQ
jgi:multiple sugar transport system permease protein